MVNLSFFSRNRSSSPSTHNQDVSSSTTASTTLVNSNTTPNNTSPLLHHARHSDSSYSDHASSSSFNSRNTFSGFHDDQHDILKKEQQQTLNNTLVLSSSPSSTRHDPSPSSMNPSNSSSSSSSSSEHSMNPLKKTRSASTFHVRKKVVIYKETHENVPFFNNNSRQEDLRSKPPVLDEPVKKFSLLEALDQSQSLMTHSDEHGTLEDDSKTSPQRSVSFSQQEHVMDAASTNRISPFMSQHEISTLCNDEPSTDKDRMSLSPLRIMTPHKTSPRNGNPAQFLTFMTEMDEKESILLSPHRKSSCGMSEDEKQIPLFERKSMDHSEQVTPPDHSSHMILNDIDSNSSNPNQVVIPENRLANMGHEILHKFLKHQTLHDDRTRDQHPLSKRVVHFKSDSIHHDFLRNEKPTLHNSNAVEPHFTVSRYAQCVDKTTNDENNSFTNSKPNKDACSHIIEYTLMNYEQNDQQQQQQLQLQHPLSSTNFVAFPMLDGKLTFEIIYNNSESTTHTEHELKITFIPKNQMNYKLHNQLVDLIYNSNSERNSMNPSYSNLQQQQQQWSLRLSVNDEKTMNNPMNNDATTTECNDSMERSNYITSRQVLTNFFTQMSRQFSSVLPNSNPKSKNSEHEQQDFSHDCIQFKSFEHFVSFMGRALEHDLHQRKHVHNFTSTSNDMLRVGFAFSMNDISIANHRDLSSIHEISQLVQHVETCCKQEEPSKEFHHSFMDFFTPHHHDGSCCTAATLQPIGTQERKILFFIIHYYSSMLDCNMSFILPLFPQSMNFTQDRKKTLEEQVIRLDSELEELLYQKYQWEYLMRFSFKVFDSRSIDPMKICISNQNRTIRHVGELKMGWTCCLLRCPLTPPGGFLPSWMHGHEEDASISSLKTNHILSIKLDSFENHHEGNGAANGGIFVGIVNGQTPMSQILQNPLLNVQGCESHTYFLKENQFRHGSMAISATPLQENQTWKSGDILDLVLDFTNHRLTVFRNYHQVISPLQDPPRIDVENCEWYFIVGMQQEGQQVTII